MELFSALGIDWKILMAQVVNFVLLGFILYKIGYQPILKFVQDRTTKIELGIKQAEQAKTALDSATAEQTRILQEAKQAAQRLLDEAKAQSLQQGQTIVERSKTEAGKVIDQAKQDIRLEHDKMLQSAKAELADVVILACERVLREKLTAQEDKALIERSLQNIK